VSKSSAVTFNSRQLGLIVVIGLGLFIMVLAIWQQVTKPAASSFGTAIVYNQPSTIDTAAVVPRNANSATTNTNDSTGSSLEAGDYGLNLLSSATKTQQDDIITYHFEDKNVLNIMPVHFAPMVVNEQTITDRQTITVAGVQGEVLTTQSAKDGSTVTVVQVKNAQYLYDFRGNDDFLRSLDHYIEFDPN
jgi:hypothetical protein